MLTVMTIAGLDPSGGAGVLADIKTFSAFGCFGTAAITSITSQNTVAVYGAYHQPAEVLRAQIEPVLDDFEIAAVKTGMLPTPETIEVTAQLITERKLPNVVVDTVIRSSSGYDLIDDEAVKHLTEKLLPLADVITPNIFEAERLTGMRVRSIDEMAAAGRLIHEISGLKGAVLVKGGHLEADATDVLYDGREVHLFRAPRIATSNTHGTGCTLSAAIAARLASGDSIKDAIGAAKRYLQKAIESAPGLGHGAGPVNHMVFLDGGNAEYAE